RSGAEAKGPPTTVVTKKKKRSLIGEKYYEQFSTEFWKEPGSQHSMTPSTLSTPGPLETGILEYMYCEVP
ncbi:13598_t:CDS:2, partial [Funneliformis mosseae]